MKSTNSARPKLCFGEMSVVIIQNILKFLQSYSDPNPNPNSDSDSDLNSDSSFKSFLIHVFQNTLFIPQVIHIQIILRFNLNSEEEKGRFVRTRQAIRVYDKQSYS